MRHLPHYDHVLALFSRRANEPRKERLCMEVRDIPNAKVQRKELARPCNQMLRYEMISLQVEDDVFARKAHLPSAEWPPVEMPEAKDGPVFFHLNSKICVVLGSFSLTKPPPLFSRIR